MILHIFLVVAIIWYTIDVFLAIYMITHPYAVTIDSERKKVTKLRTVIDVAIHPFVAIVVLQYLKDEKDNEDDL